MRCPCSGAARDLDERQQTLSRALTWSYDLLTPAEQRLFRRLAVFAGGCTLEAAEAVCAVPEGAEPLGSEVLNGLGTLVDHSLIQQREEGGEARFSMMHVIREFAVEQLEASREAEALRRACAACVLGLVERAESELTGSDAVEWLVVLDREYDNVRAALGWARERGWAETGLRLVAGIWRYCETRGLLREGRAWLETLVALHPRDASGESRLVRMVDVEHRARALLGCGRLAVWQGGRARRAVLVRADGRAWPCGARPADGGLRAELLGHPGHSSE